MLEHKKLCHQCEITGYVTSGILKPQNIIRVRYKPELIHNLTPTIDVFQGTFVAKPKVVNWLTAEPSSWEYHKDAGLSFNAGGMFEEGSEISSIQSEILNFKDIPQKIFVEYDKMFLDNVCGSCSLGKNKYFCDYNNPHCLSMGAFKDRIAVLLGKI
jgi:hypothetical protein